MTRREWALIVLLGLVGLGAWLMVNAMQKQEEESKAGIERFNRVIQRSAELTRHGTRVK